MAESAQIEKLHYSVNLWKMKALFSASFPDFSYLPHDTLQKHFLLSFMKHTDILISNGYNLITMRIVKVKLANFHKVIKKHSGFLKLEM